MSLEVQKAKNIIEGVTYVDDGINFIFILDKNSNYKKPCILNLYTKSFELLEKIRLLDVEGLPLVKGAFIKGEDINKIVAFEVRQGKDSLINRTARRISGRCEFGKRKEGSKAKNELTCLFKDDDFNWGNDSTLMLPNEKIVSYKLHARGFTKALDTPCAGTFLGIKNKIPYLKELGISQIELMPIYDFDEVEKDSNRVIGKGKKSRINYWGYKKAYYYAIKKAFAFDKEYPEREFKELVKECHKNNIEVILDFYFENVSSTLIADIIRYWLFNYHIDGVHISSSDYAFLTKEPFLFNRRLYVDYYDGERNEVKPLSYNDGFLVSARRFIKGEEYAIDSLLSYFMIDAGDKVNYLASHNGFTLLDCFSYEVKHNEKNGLNNTDGTDYNFSFNLGIEGHTRLKRIVRLRQKHVKNALFLLMLGRGIPLIMAGDEALRTQDGNNNAFCQDNLISWLDWNNENKDKLEIREFFKKLVTFRKNNGILSCDLSSIKNRGNINLPLISLHSDMAFSFVGGNSRAFGLLYNATLSTLENKNDLIYIAVNMSASHKRLAIPKVENVEMKIHLSTDENVRLENEFVILPEFSCALIVN